MNLRSFKLNRVYLGPLNMSDEGGFSWSWILKDFVQVQKEEEKSSSCVHLLHKTSNLQVSRRSRGVDVKETECTKKSDARAELLFWSLNLLFFEVVVVRRRSCLISSLFSKVDERRLNARYVGFHYFLNKTSLFQSRLTVDISTLNLSSLSCVRRGKGWCWKICLKNRW